MSAKEPPLPFDVRAVFDYTARNDNEMSLENGKVYQVVQTEISGLWYYAKGPSGSYGWFPSSYTDIITLFKLPALRIFKDLSVPPTPTTPIFKLHILGVRLVLPSQDLQFCISIKDAQNNIERKVNECFKVKNSDQYDWNELFEVFISDAEREVVLVQLYGKKKRKIAQLDITLHGCDKYTAPLFSYGWIKFSEGKGEVRLWLQYTDTNNTSSKGSSSISSLGGPQTPPLSASQGSPTPILTSPPRPSIPSPSGPIGIPTLYFTSGSRVPPTPSVLSGSRGPPIPSGSRGPPTPSVPRPSSRDSLTSSVPSGSRGPPSVPIGSSGLPPIFQSGSRGPPTPSVPSVPIGSSGLPSPPPTPSGSSEPPSQSEKERVQSRNLRRCDPPTARLQPGKRFLDIIPKCTQISKEDIISCLTTYATSHPSLDANIITMFKDKIEDFKELYPSNKSLSLALCWLYTVDCWVYQQMNFMLREDSSVMEQLSPLIYNLMMSYRIINDTKFFYSGTVYRRSRLTDKNIQFYQPGVMFVWSSFTSTTIEFSVEDNFGDVLFVIDVPRKMSRYALKLEEISSFPSEYEVLLLPNVGFLVNAIKTEQQVSYQNVRVQIEVEIKYVCVGGDLDDDGDPTAPVAEVGVSVDNWSVSQVVEWMKTLQLSKDYTKLIEDNQIDGRVLMIMSDTDWKEIGMTIFGDRKKCLNAQPKK